jgi:hypothetical protein
MRSIVAALPLLLAACADQDVVSIRIELQPDWSGTVCASALKVPDAPGPLEPLAGGVTWESRANLFCCRGRFAHIDQLKIADIAFRGGKNEAGIAFVTASIPRGEKATWIPAMAPARAERQKVAEVYDPTRELRNPGSSVRIEITLPSPIVGHGVQPKSRGVTSDANKNKATLIVPVDNALTAGESFVWDVTWR